MQYATVVKQQVALLFEERTPIWYTYIGLNNGVNSRQDYLFA